MENIFVIQWTWGKRGKKDHNRFSVIDLVMILGSLALEEQKERYASTFSLLVALKGASLGLVVGAFLF